MKEVLMSAFILNCLLPESVLMGGAWLMGRAINMGKKCLLWMLWLASMRRRTAATRTATHSFLLSNMAGRWARLGAGPQTADQ